MKRVMDVMRRRARRNLLRALRAKVRKDNRSELRAFVAKVQSTLRLRT